MKPSLRLSAVVCCALFATGSFAQGKSGKTAVTTAPALAPWMSPEVGEAWSQGFKGQGVTITVIDDFTSGSRFAGKLGSTSETLRHGEWTLKEASMVAPSATMRSKDFGSGTSVSLAKGMNVLNLSYGMLAAAGYSASQIAWGAQEKQSSSTPATVRPWCPRRRAMMPWPWAAPMRRAMWTTWA